MEPLRTSERGPIHLWARPVPCLVLPTCFPTLFRRSPHEIEIQFAFLYILILYMVFLFHDFQLLPHLTHLKNCKWAGAFM